MKTPLSITFSFVQNLERFHQLVAAALDDPHLGLGLVLEGAQVERHAAEPLGGGAVKVSGVFHLQHIGFLRLLVDGDLGVLLPAVTFARRDEDVHGVDLVQLKVKLVVLFALRLVGVLDDGLLSVDGVLLQLMRQHPLDGLAVVALGHLLHCIRYDVRLKSSMAKCQDPDRPSLPAKYIQHWRSFPKDQLSKLAWRNSR